ncbi:hypothetical protein Raf01_63430 [Rugosimonospora africana]|uniref:Uncharacterized protein n=1 Tax=Rugosimonospora africana TaxID=556532 RepID=A0A8J3R0W2_9ACTN|nr:hypothetical protein Raf01_63430 [Rugosimonospora africana]
MAYVWYDKATAPDRTTPVLAVRQYGSAYLGRHDDVRAAKFACADQSGLVEVKKFRDDLDARSKANNFTVYVNLDTVREVSRSGDTAHVAVVIVLLASANGEQLRRVENWDFTAKRQDGWRACGAHQVS